MNPPTLPTQPEEPYLTVLEKLNIPSTVALHQTSQHFHQLANPTLQLRRSQMNKSLLEAQKSPRSRKDGLAYFTCNKLLPRHRFTDKHTKGRRGRNGSQ